MSRVAVDYLIDAIEKISERTKGPLRSELIGIVGLARKANEKPDAPPPGQGGPPVKADSANEIAQTEAMFNFLMARDLGDRNSFVESIHEGYQKYGSLTIKQYNALLKIHRKFAN